MAVTNFPDIRLQVPRDHQEATEQLLRELNRWTVQLNALSAGVDNHTAGIAAVAAQIATVAASVVTLTSPSQPGAPGQPGGGGGGGSGVGPPVFGPAPPPNSIQFNNAGAFAGNANLTFDGTTFATGNFNKVYNVLTFGAKCDGVTDDTAAVQAAFNAANAVGSATVEFPPGLCVINTTISLTGVNGLTIRGAGKRSTQIIASGGAAGNTTDVFSFSLTTAQVQIHDLTIVGNSGASAGNLIHINSPGGQQNGSCIIHDCEFQFGNTQLKLERSNTNRVYACDFLNYTQEGVNVSNVTNVDNGGCMVWGCYFSTTAVHGADIEWNSGGEFHFFGNSCLSTNGTYAVLVNLTVVNGHTSDIYIGPSNHIEGSPTYGIYIGAGVSGAQLSNIQILGNEVAFSAPTGSNNCVVLNNNGGGGSLLAKIIVADNVLEGATNGVLALSPAGVDVHGNYIRDCTNGVNFSSVTIGQIGTNKMQNVTTPYTGLDANTLFADDGASFTVATLPTVAAGSRVFASDGNPNTAPITGVGNGTLALKQAAQWIGL